MSANLFRGLFDAASASVILPTDFLLCIIVSLLIGFILSLMVQWKSKKSESFSITIALLPATVCVVIMMVNGNIGAALATAGAFSLIRFRSIAGSGRQIIAVFIAMAAGLLAGMGYLAYAVLFAILLGSTVMLYTACNLGSNRTSLPRRLRITIPENLNYENVFDPVLGKYTSQYTLRQVKSTNMGSMFKLTYDITLQSDMSSKTMLDELRCLNGNLELSLSLQEDEDTGL